MIDQHQPRRSPVVFGAALTDRWWVILPLLALLLLSPTLLYGRPYLFWDTEQYFHYGDQLSAFASGRIAHFIVRYVPWLSETGDSEHSANGGMVLDSGAPTGPESNARTLLDQKSKAAGIAFYGARSPFYSVWLYAIARIVGLWGVVVTQAVAISWLVWRLATQVAREHSFAAATAMVTVVSLGSSAWFFVGFVMPDVYAATALLSIALLFAYADRMSLWERVGAAALLAASSLFHVTHLVTAIAAAVAGFVAGYFWRSEMRVPWRRAAFATGIALAVAVAMQFAFDAAARTLLGTALKRPPFLTARIIADGPGKLYLDSACQQQTFFLCSYRQRDFRNADAFLWSGTPDSGLFSTITVEQRLRLIDEEPSFVAAVVAQYPIAVVKAMVSNAIEQFALIWPSEAWADPGASFGDPNWRDKGLFEVAPFLRACVARLGSCVPMIPESLVAAIVFATTLASLGVIAAHFTMQIFRAAGAQSTDCAYQRAIIFSLLIVASLVVNAAICGAISGPHPRYQARVAWLAILAASVLELSKPSIVTYLRKPWSRLVSLLGRLVPRHNALTPT